MNKQIARMLSLLLSALMIAALFAGCTGGGAEGEETAAKEVVFPLEEPVHIKIAVKGNTDFDAKLPMNTLFQKVQEETNVYVDFINLGDEPATSLNAMLATGDRIDVILGDVINDSMLTDLAYGGFLKPIEDYVTNEKIMPNYVRRGLANVPTALRTMTLPDGHIYSVARLDTEWGNDLESPLLVNEKWLEQSGIGAIETIGDFHDYLVYVRDNDVNGNGDPGDEVPLLLATTQGSPYAHLQAALSLWGSPCKNLAQYFYARIDGDKVAIVPATEAYKDAVRTLGEWFREGLIWSEMFTANSESFRAKLNNSGYQLWGATFDGFEVDANSGYFDDLAYIPLPKVEGYQPRAFMNAGLWGYRGTFTVTAMCEEPEICLAWLDRFYSQEYSVAATYGLPDDPETIGTAPTYTVDENGNYTFLKLTQEERQHNADIRTTMNGLFGSFFWLRAPEDYACGAVSSSGITAKRLEAYRMYKEAGCLNSEEETWPKPYAGQDDVEEMFFLYTDILAIINQYEPLWVTGQSDVDADWDGYMTKLENAGLSRLTDILQKNFDAYMANGAF